MAAHSSILTWRIAWTEEPGRLQSVVSQRDGHDWVWLTHFFTSSWVVVGGQESSVGRGRLQRLSFKLGSELLHFSKLEFLPGRDAREEHPVRPFGWAHAQSTHLTDLDQTVAEATGTGWTSRFPWMCSSSYFFFFLRVWWVFFRPLYIYSCRLLWVFVAVLRLSRVAASRGYSLVAVHWLLLLQSTDPKACGLRSCSMMALQCRLSSWGAGACGFFQDQLSNRWPQHCKAVS